VSRLFEKVLESLLIRLLTRSPGITPPHRRITVVWPHQIPQRPHQSSHVPCSYPVRVPHQIPHLVWNDSGPLFPRLEMQEKKHYLASCLPGPVGR
jgi:hypothetical protein